MRTAPASAVAFCLICGTLGARGQEIPCTAVDDDPPAFPCGFEIERLALQKAPTLLRFQARIAQAKLPLGDTSFATVVVKLLRGTEVLCMEQISKVEVHKSVMNLTLGQNMTCDLGLAIAENANLAFQVCLGGADNCLKPIELSTLPYAIKASHAGLAQAAGRANVAGQASYAARATADRDLLLRKKLGAGYFDFSTPAASEAADVHPGAAYQAYEDGGFLQWSPVRNANARRLHLVGKSDATDRLELLDELVLASARTLVRGDLRVVPPDDGAGLVVTQSGMSVVGSSDVNGALLVTGVADLGGLLSATGDAGVQGELLVAGTTTIQSGGLHVTGASGAGGELTVLGGLAVQSGLQVAGQAEVKGALGVTDAKVTAGLSVLGAASFGTLEAGAALLGGALTAASAAVTGTATLGSTVDVTGGLTVGGGAVFHELVTFADAALGIDPRYLLATGETRDLTVDAKVTFGQPVALAGDLDLAYHPLLNARVQSAAAPPVACTAATEGLVYLDTSVGKLSFCLDGAYQIVAGEECGNAYVEPSEACDDGNTEAGDGCSPECIEEGPPWTCTPKSVQPTECTQ